MDQKNGSKFEWSIAIDYKLIIDSNFEESLFVFNRIFLENAKT